MRYRKLDEDGDMSFGNGLIDFYIDTPEAVAQSILTRLRLWVGEWFLDETEGTPYSQAVLGVGKRATIEPAIRTRIIATPGVTEIISLEVIIDENRRTANIIGEVDTIFGTSTLTGII
jgi:hypothetical protein